MLFETVGRAVKAMSTEIFSQYINMTQMLETSHMLKFQSIALRLKTKNDKRGKGEQL